MRGKDNPGFSGLPPGLGLVPAVLDTIPSIIGTSRWPRVPSALSLCRCCPPTEGDSLGGERRTLLGGMCSGVACQSPLLPNWGGVVPPPAPSLCATDHRGVHPASRRDHGAGAARSVQGRPHRDHPHPDQLQHGRAGGKARGCRGHLLASAGVRG